MEIFEKIKNDSNIIKIYNEIENPKDNEKFWTYHGWSHINNVVEMVEKILIQLGYNEEYIENAKIAALLHDLGMIKCKDNHDIRSYNMAKKYFEKNNIELKYKDEILDAIKSHRNAYNSDNVMAIVLIFADKIDIKKTRLTTKGYEIIGLRQYQFINDINVFKEKDNLTVKFTIDNRCNKQELEEYYFTPKVFKAIRSFASYFKYNLKILWNDEEWKYKYL